MWQEDAFPSGEDASSEGAAGGGGRGGDDDTSSIRRDNFYFFSKLHFTEFFYFPEEASCTKSTAFLVMYLSLL